MTERLIVITPHLGDAVQGCGELIAAHPGAVVVTVFAEIPADAYVVSEWDALCGFSSPRQAVTVRRREDRLAMDVLDAEPCWLACRDSQYRSLRKTPAQALEDEISLKLTRALRRHGRSRAALPLGLLAGDHTLAHRAALRLVRRRTDMDWIAYEDGTAPADTVAARLASLERLGLAAASMEAPPREAVYRKEQAVRRYESLLRGYAAAGRPVPFAAGAERYWRLSK